MKRWSAEKMAAMAECDNRRNCEGCVLREDDCSQTVEEDCISHIKELYDELDKMQSLIGDGCKPVTRRKAIYKKMHKYDSGTKLYVFSEHKGWIHGFFTLTSGGDSGPVAVFETITGDIWEVQTTERLTFEEWV
jgi:hypothetical protein